MSIASSSFKITACAVIQAPAKVIAKPKTVSMSGVIQSMKKPLAFAKFIRVYKFIFKFIIVVNVSGKFNLHKCSFNRAIHNPHARFGDACNAAN